VKCLLVADLHCDLRKFDWVLAAAETVDVVVLAGDHLDAASPATRRSGRTAGSGCTMLRPRARRSASTAGGRSATRHCAPGSRFLHRTSCSPATSTNRRFAGAAPGRIASAPPGSAMPATRSAPCPRTSSSIWMPQGPFGCRSPVPRRSRSKARPAGRSRPWPSREEGLGVVDHVDNGLAHRERAGGASAAVVEQFTDHPSSASCLKAKRQRGSKMALEVGIGRTFASVPPR